jgi:hypothetical protein
MNPSNDPNKSSDQREEIGLSKLSDHIDLHNPPSAPLQFPHPAFLAVRRSSVLAIDHRTACRHLVKAIVKRTMRCSLHSEDTAYFLKTMLKKTIEKPERTWAAIVLRPTKDSRNHADDRVSLFGLEWMTTDEIVLIKVSPWGQLSLSQKQGLLHVGTQRSW